MYSNNSDVSGQEKMFRDVLDSAVESLEWRLDNHDAWNDPLEREQLTLLLDEVTEERLKIALGKDNSYGDLGCSIKGAVESGEPANSVLMRALSEVDRMFRSRLFAEA